MNGLSRTNGQSNPLQPICAPMYGKYHLRPRPPRPESVTVDLQDIDNDI